MGVRSITIYTLFVLYLIGHRGYASNFMNTKTFTHADVNITYKDPLTGQIRVENRVKMGKFGLSSHIDRVEGIIVHVRTRDNKHHGCTPIVNKLPSEKWIALIERGECNFKDKIRNAAIVKNASAVVIYNNSDVRVDMVDNVDNVTSVIIDRNDGLRIASLVDNGTTVYMIVTVGDRATGADHGNLNHTSVLFVTISFIVLLIISLAWLVFYYIQRFRYAHAKERLAKRLMHAAKKAISKMPMKTLKSEDKLVSSGYEQCAVCIEDYYASDVIRILPCKHVFHKSCVDPWLIEHRSCPMCKLDILKAYGLQIHNSEASLANLDTERGSTSVGTSDHHHGHETTVSVDDTGLDVATGGGGSVRGSSSRHPRSNTTSNYGCPYWRTSSDTTGSQPGSRRSEGGTGSRPISGGSQSAAQGRNPRASGSTTAVISVLHDVNGGADSVSVVYGGNTISLDTDSSSSEGQPIATCVLPDIHRSALDELDTHEEGCALYACDTPERDQACSKQPEPEEEPFLPIAKCTCTAMLSAQRSSHQKSQSEASRRRQTTRKQKSNDRNSDSDTSNETDGLLEGKGLATVRRKDGSNKRPSSTGETSHAVTTDASGAYYKKPSQKKVASTSHKDATDSSVAESENEASSLDRKRRGSKLSSGSESIKSCQSTGVTS